MNTSSSQSSLSNHKNKQLIPPINKIQKQPIFMAPRKPTTNTEKKTTPLSSPSPSPPPSKKRDTRNISPPPRLSPQLPNNTNIVPSGSSTTPLPQFARIGFIKIYLQYQMTVCI